MRHLAALGLPAAVLLIVSGCAGSGGKWAEEVRVGRNVRPKVFAIFPASVGSRQCVIPWRGPKPQTLRGTCETSVRVLPGIGFLHQRVALVRFTERWRGVTPDRRTPQHHTWQVIEKLANLKVIGIQSTGAYPPQKPGTFPAPTS